MHREAGRAASNQGTRHSRARLRHLGCSRGDKIASAFYAGRPSQPWKISTTDCCSPLVILHVGAAAGAATDTSTDSKRIKSRSLPRREAQEVGRPSLAPSMIRHWGKQRAASAAFSLKRRRDSGASDQKPVHNALLWQLARRYAWSASYGTTTLTEVPQFAKPSLVPSQVPIVRVKASPRQFGDSM